MLNYTELFRTADIAVFAYGDDFGRGERIVISYRFYNEDGKCIRSGSRFQPATMVPEELASYAIRRLGFSKAVRDWKGDTFWAEAGRTANRLAKSVYMNLQGKGRYFFPEDYASALSKATAKEIGLPARREPFRVFISELAEAWSSALSESIFPPLMIKLHTSNFSKLRESVNPISISRSVPKGIRNIRTYPALAPSWELMNTWKNGSVSWADYAELYRKETLDALSRQNVLSELTALAGDTEFTLICWERSGTPCHRHIASAWLKGTKEYSLKDT